MPAGRIEKLILLGFRRTGKHTHRDSRTTLLSSLLLVRILQTHFVGDVAGSDGCETGSVDTPWFHHRVGAAFEKLHGSYLRTVGAQRESERIRRMRKLRASVKAPAGATTPARLPRSAIEETAAWLRPATAVVVGPGFHWPRKFERWLHREVHCAPWGRWSGRKSHQRKRREPGQGSCTKGALVGSIEQERDGPRQLLQMGFQRRGESIEPVRRAEEKLHGPRGHDVLDPQRDDGNALVHRANRSLFHDRKRWRGWKR